MLKSIPIVTVAMLLSCSLLGGCSKTPGTPAEPAASPAPSAPAKPDAPEAVVSDKPNSTPGATANAGAAVSASVSANGAEARAGDVSVKVPD